MFVYEDIAFRVIEEYDLEALRRLHNDPSTWINLYNIDFVDEQAQIEWWKNLHRRQNERRFAICLAEKPREVIGRLRIQNINHQHRNCEVGLDILPEYRGKGYGKKSYRMLLDFLFNHYNMNMVYLKVAEFNRSARSLYEKVGFRETGRLPKAYYRDGEYWDYVIMSMTRDEYKQI